MKKELIKRVWVDDEFKKLKILKRDLKILVEILLDKQEEIEDELRLTRFESFLPTRKIDGKEVRGIVNMSGEWKPIATNKF